MDSDQLFRRLQEALVSALGEKEAWTLADLAAHCGTSRREVEACLEERLADLGFVIVSGTPGLWRPLTAEEVNHYQASLQSRLRKLAIRKRTVRRLAARSGFVREGKEFRDPPARQAELWPHLAEAGR